MIKQYVGLHNKRYIVSGLPLGKGGEGCVYAIDGNNRYVLKVYHANNQTKHKEEKLIAMACAPISEEALKQVAWPVDVVYEKGHFVGFVMPRAVNVEELNVMYSGKYICTLSEKITIAKNLCAAVNAVHEAGHVCGDLNPQNITVNIHQGTVMLVDTDSYHIMNGFHQFRCEVGRPEYIPVEVQLKMQNGMTLSSAPLPTYSKQSDCFAIAVHIFALLMNGCHPFACAATNTKNNNIEPPQPIDNIRNGFFPFKQSKNGLTIPAYAPDFNYLPDNIQKLFIRAFMKGHTDPSERPTASEWYHALEQMGSSLKACSVNKKHLFPITCNKCPWCDVTSKLSAVKQIIVANTVLPGGLAGGPTKGNSHYSFNNPNPSQQYTVQPTATKYQNGHTSFVRNGKVSALIALAIVFVIAIALGIFNNRNNNVYNMNQATAAQLSNYRPISTKSSDTEEYQIKANYSYEPGRYSPFIINLNGQFDRISLGYYVNNPWGEEGGIRFTIYADGNPIYDTGYIPYGTNIESNPSVYNYLSLDVRNVYNLELRADYNGVSGTYERQYVGIIDPVAYKDME